MHRKITNVVTWKVRI